MIWLFGGWKISVCNGTNFDDGMPKKRRGDGIIKKEGNLQIA